MRLRASLVASAVAVILALPLFGPMAVVQLTGKPLVLDCGGLESVACQEKMLEFAEAYENHGYGLFGWGPVTYFTFDSIVGACGAVTIERGTFTFGVLAITAQPLC